MVREGGVEPPCPCGHTDLNRARLPIPPLARCTSSWHAGHENDKLHVVTAVQGDYAEGLGVRRMDVVPSRSTPPRGQEDGVAGHCGTFVYMEPLGHTVEFVLYR